MHLLYPLCFVGIVFQALFILMHMYFAFVLDCEMIIPADEELPQQVVEQQHAVSSNGNI